MLCISLPWFVIEGRAFDKALYVVATYNALHKDLNEATAFHPWLPQRSRRARLCAWAARKLPSGAAWRMQMAGVAWNSCTLWTFALHAGRACNPREDGVVRTQIAAVAKAA